MEGQNRVGWKVDFPICIVFLHGKRRGKLSRPSLFGNALSHLQLSSVKSEHMQNSDRFESFEPIQPVLLDVSHGYGLDIKGSAIC